MSRESRRNNNRSVNTDTQQKITCKEEKFEIVNTDKVEFKGLNKSAFMKSSKVCSIANEIFSKVYDDFEGSTFEVTPAGDMYICLWFNHNVIENSDSVVAFSQYANSIDASNELVGKIKNRDIRNKLGDNYVITSDGKEGLEKFMKRSVDNTILRNNKNKVLWDRCYVDMADQQQYYNNVQQVQKKYTKLSYIDVASIFKFKHGSSIVTGKDAVTGKDIRSSVKFDVKLHQELINPTVNGFYSKKEFLLKIDQINEDELKLVLQEMGVGAYTSFGIIK